jgi:hypothetical protein
MLNSMGLGSGTEKHQGYTLNFLFPAVKLDYINANLLGLIQIISKPHNFFYDALGY